MENNEQYQVFISFRKFDDNGRRTKESLAAKKLFRLLTQNGFRVFLKQSFGADSPSEEENRAMEDAKVLVVVIADTDNASSREIRADYQAFTTAAQEGKKTAWRIITYLCDLERTDLPNALSQHYSFSRFETDKMVDWLREKLSAQPARQCISDEEEPAVSGEYMPMTIDAMESLPESAADDSDDDWDTFTREARESANRRSRMMRRAAEENDLPATDSLEEPAYMEQPPSPAAAKQTPIRVKPEKINKVDFSVVAPEKVKPGNGALVDVLMYTKSQRGIVKRVIEQSHEKAAEAARSAGSVSVKQGSRVTVVLSSDDAILSDNSETLIWSGDALDFQFRFTVPEDCRKKQLDFSCNILFDGIHISRLYFSVPVNAGKTVPIRFVRKDSKRAFVSYSHKDKQRVVDQLCAIQRVAPKLRFWMDSQSMSAGDLWRPSIKAAIKSADVFLLFWSSSSKESSEVRKEWEYALLLEKGSKRGRNGARFISPVPLDDPKNCPPPPELNDLHFGDPSFDADVEHIEDIHFVMGKRGMLGNIKFI